MVVPAATFFRCENVLDNTKGLYNELKDNYYKYPAQLFPLTWLNDPCPCCSGVKFVWTGKGMN